MKKQFKIYVSVKVGNKGYYKHAATTKSKDGNEFLCNVVGMRNLLEAIDRLPADEELDVYPASRSNDKNSTVTYFLRDDKE